MTTFKKLFSILIAISLSIPALAQDETKNMRMIATFELDPSKEADWDKAWSNIVSMAKKENYPYAEFVASHRNKRWIVTPIENYAEIDAVNTARGEVAQKSGDKFAKAIAAFNSAEINTHTFITRHDPELSYMPEGVEEGMYARIETYSYRPGHSEKLRSLLADYKEARSSMNLPYGYEVYWNAMGSEGNSVTFITTAENAVALAEADAILTKATSEKEEMGAMFEKFLKIVLSSETEHATLRPDLSILPAE